MNKRILTHIIIVIALLGLVMTALAAEFFFSKESIMIGLQHALGILEITIAPADQFFIAQVIRRVTWDWHFYIGMFFLLGVILSFIQFVRNKSKRDLANTIIVAILITVSLILIYSGIIMYSRLYVDVSKEFFITLKAFHMWTYIILLILVLSHGVKKISSRRKNEK